ncbi:MAG: cytochrome-c peroxidase [Thermoleophilia bacterium]
MQMRRSSGKKWIKIMVVAMAAAATVLLAGLGPALADDDHQMNGTQLTMKQSLGKFLYFDKRLSTPDGQACASCHSPSAGFADPDHQYPTSQGVIMDRWGGRNSPSAAYAAFSPPFHYEAALGYVGGQFWDGRASTLADQAKGPFLNPLEMNNPSKLAVVQDVRTSSYAWLFRQVYGPNSFDNTDMAFDNIADAIAAYEGTSELNRFDSKYDRYLKGEAKLNSHERRGLELFNGKAGCSSCHPSQAGPGGQPPVFTDFTYDNLGVPKNWKNKYLYLPPSLNPDGPGWIDYGLGKIVGDSSQDGKFKVPALRNVAVTKPYMHNGYFTSLRDVVNFYNTRDVGSWPAPEVPANVNHTETGNLGLSTMEVDNIVAFLNTLTDKRHEQNGQRGDENGDSDGRGDGNGDG